MTQEQIKEVLERIRSKKNNATNELAVAAEEISVNAANTATAQAESGTSTMVNRTLRLSSDTVELMSYYTDTLYGEGAFLAQNQGGAGYYGQYYLYTICKVDLQKLATSLNLTVNDLLNATLIFTPGSISGGSNLCEFSDLNGEYVASWDTSGCVELSVNSIYNASTGKAEFMIYPPEDCDGFILFYPFDISFNYNDYFTSLSIELSKVNYLEGETFKESDVIVKANRENGSFTTLLRSEYEITVSNFNTSFDANNEMRSVAENTFTITATYAGCITTRDVTIFVYPIENVLYKTNGNALQVMDIHIPKKADGSYKTGPFPVVITIHGGNWVEGSKGHYTYMTDFITNATDHADLPGCNCVHVNMNYRLTTDTASSNGVTIAEMMEDIGLVIGYISNQENATVYHIDTSKIALMGHSAGGHLALLYAYTHPTQIDLLISEAGPTDLVAAALNAPQYYRRIFKNLIGVEYGDTNWDSAYNNASPSYIATQTEAELPFTIYARGATDQVVHYDQNANLVKALLPSSIWEDNETKLKTLITENDEKLTNASNCAFFSFASYGHQSFGSTIKPTSTDTVVGDYYQKIEDKIKNLL